MCATASRSSSRSTVSTAPGCKGHVDSLSPASGLEFALLPPDNATGNFTKIVQRVPVKIVLDDQQPEGPAAPGHVGGADRQHQGDRLSPSARPKPAGSTRASPGRAAAHAAGRLSSLLDNPFALPGLSKQPPMHPRCREQEEPSMTTLQHHRSIAASVRRQPAADGAAAAGHLRKDLDRGDRRDARRLHGGAQHPDRQRLARRHPGRDRRRHRRRRLDLDLLSDRRDRRDPAERLARPGVLGPHLSPDQRRPVPGALGGLRASRRTCRR